MVGLGTVGPDMALASEKGLSEAGPAWPVLRGMALASLKGFPRSRLSPPRLPPPPSRVRDTRRRCASRSTSPSSMLSSVKKSGLLVKGLALDVPLFEFVLPPRPRAAKMSFLF